tara:strand:+ start:25443 stop:25619 length:177 start_codon:yes stop_codon:yes gene_type:complete
MKVKTGQLWQLHATAQTLLILEVTINHISYYDYETGNRCKYARCHVEEDLADWGQLLK